eukprot:TRINITY_DN19224_c0_g1_i1.p1 TRINITY_DN19224_c0_g1~~TRINITY_DN19224_c0_g1_i1.p1  ORF type:complete len:322 (-),score=87.06 TRINITY_DN19224_c0_g1_i1:83-1048(-)
MQGHDSFYNEQAMTDFFAQLGNTNNDFPIDLNIPVQEFTLVDNSVSIDTPLWQAAVGMSTNYNNNNNNSFINGNQNNIQNNNQQFIPQQNNNVSNFNNTSIQQDGMMDNQLWRNPLILNNSDTKMQTQSTNPLLNRNVIDNNNNNNNHNNNQMNTNDVPETVAPKGRGRKKDDSNSKPAATVKKGKGKATAPTTTKKKRKSAPEEEFDDDDDVGSDNEKKRQKNRQAAKMFRQRQKDYVEDLEAQVETLQDQNKNLQSKVDLLIVENKLVREQLAYMRNFCSSAFQFAFPPDKLKAIHDSLDSMKKESPDMAVTPTSEAEQ